MIITGFAFDRQTAPSASAIGKAAGIAFRDAMNNFLFMRRGPKSDFPGTWAFPAGGIEEGETAEQAALREAGEETGWIGDDIKLLNEDENFTTFSKHVQEQFEPKLNDEHTEFVWAPGNNPPQPLHPNVKKLLDAGFASDASLAFDRSVRSYDADGRLHVAIMNISKANICEYLGSEIPDCEALGLDPMKLYKLLRDPEELAKAAATFNKLPILSEHIPVSREDHRPELVVGALGTDANFVDPYLQNSGVFWAGDAISAIESEEKKELSASYRYRADMTPGTFKGAAYDGVMRDIIGNHVAQVKEGRAGTDVVVGDAKLVTATKEILTMKGLSSRKALLAQGAVMAFLLPRLAADAKIDIGPLFAGVTAKNFKESAPKIVEGVNKLTKDKLAKDANVETLDKLLDVLGSTEPEGIDELSTDPSSALPPAAAKTMDSDVGAKIKAMLEGLVPPELMAQIEALFTPAADANNPFAKKEGDEPGKDAEPDKDKDVMGKDEVNKAIATATKLATDNAIKAQQAIREAESFVRPWVGELTVAFDSAEAVHRKTLEMLGQDSKGIHPSALQALIKLCPKPSETKKNPAREMAQDGANAASFAKRFPHASRISAV